MTKRLILLIFTSAASYAGFAQQTPPPDTPVFTLDQCIAYALKHEPTLNEAILSQAVQHSTNAISLAGWLPQVNASGNLQHYIQQPTTFVSNGAGGYTKEKTGVVNTFIPTLSVTQAIFSPTLLSAAKIAPLYNKAALQVTDSTQIGVVTSVSKGFYNLLLTLEQIDVLKEDTARLDKNLSDTYHQYIGGIVDETDYDEAKIELNNSKAQLKQSTENVLPQYAALKQVMGFPPDSQFNVRFDTAQMMRDVAFDTTQALQYDKRIEFQQLMTAKNIQQQLTRYYRTAWLPTLSAFYDYNYEFESNTTSNFFAQSYPNSYIGLSLSIPIFTGFARAQSLHRAHLQEQELDFEQVRLVSEIYSEYTAALANYKGNYYNLEMMQENTDLARRTYKIVSLQYNQGVVAYLNVITAESNLISSEIGYLNALFQLLSSKIDLQKAMGYIH
ncbi:TolC family protein [Dinghuibacter silviterrae]|uniref:Outer membrane protein TolC n=1 Tax=Dinghuibacter silviterrae TaxID=1539049 RepID=A0A4V3GM46_9BACT|nr:TolC family protein [Dinghuibacter silviterrae]TDX02003.1 outer membrane protein TolC [Dinghuibacter silviterrae]